MRSEEVLVGSFCSLQNIKDGVFWGTINLHVHRTPHAAHRTPHTAHPKICNKNNGELLLLSIIITTVELHR